jgi:hypothetical protein
LELLGAVEKPAVPLGFAYSRPAPRWLELGGKRAQELTFFWKPMAAHLAGPAWQFSQNGPKQDPLVRMSCPHSDSLQPKPKEKKGG